MPPKAQYTRSEIAAAAFQLIKQEGVSALTTRALAQRLHTSVSPIFTAFENMDEVKMAARELALAEFMDFVSDYRDYTPAFKRIGMMFVAYGIHEPELFKLLFMQEHKEPLGFQNSVKDLGEIPAVCVELICRDYGISKEDAEFLFEQCWTQAFGLGALCAAKVCTLTDAEIGKRLGAMFGSHIMLIKSGKLNEVYSDVEKHSDGHYHGMALKDSPFI